MPDGQECQLLGFLYFWEGEGIKIMLEHAQWFYLPKAKYISHNLKIVSEYDQEIPQSQTADNPIVTRGRATQPTGDTRKTN